MGRLTGFVRSAITHSDAPPPQNPQGFIDWDSIPAPPPLLGREQDASQLIHWLDAERSRLIGVHAMGGQGKSALVASVVRSLIGPSPVPGQSTGGSGRAATTAAMDGIFQVVLWRSLAAAPDLHQLIHSWVTVLAGRELNPMDEQDDCISALIECMRRWRCLLILDDVDGILQTDGGAGQVAADQAIYAELFKRVGNSSHQSSLIVISRESLVDVEGLAWGKEGNAHNFWLGPLSVEASHAWLVAQGVIEDQPVLTEIADYYSGNPLALGVVADAIRMLHFGDGASFLANQISVFDIIRVVIDNQFARLSPLEQEMMAALEQAQTALTWNDLRQRLLTGRSERAVIEAQLSLLRRGLVISQPAGITLPNLILEYMQERETVN